MSNANKKSLSKFMNEVYNMDKIFKGQKNKRSMNQELFNLMIKLKEQAKKKHTD